MQHLIFDGTEGFATALAGHLNEASLRINVAELADEYDSELLTRALATKAAITEYRASRDYMAALGVGRRFLETARDSDIENAQDAAREIAAVEAAFAEDAR